jgi:hypothetical protein
VSILDSNNLFGVKDVTPGILQFLVSAITQRLVFTMLAATEEHFFGFLRNILYGPKFRVCVGTITEGLFGTLTACAPKVRFTGIHFYGVRKFLDDFRGCHGMKLQGIFFSAWS